MKEIELVLVCSLKDVLQKEEGVPVMCKLNADRDGIQN